MRTRRAMYAILVACLALTMATPALPAQQVQGVPVGDTVRVWAPSINISRRRARVLPWAGSVARFRDLRTSSDPSDTLEIPFIRLTRLEVLDGKDRRLGIMRGIGIGAGIGLLLGTVVGKAAVSGCREFLCEADAVGYALGLGLAGGVIGGAVGSTSPPDRWRRVDLPVEAGFPPYVKPWHQRTWWVLLTTVAGLVVTAAVN